MKPYAFSGMLCTSMLIFGLIGYNIDGWLHTTPLFVIIGLLYSIIGSVILLIKLRLTKKDIDIFNIK